MSTTYHESDLYNILGIPRCADDQQIKKAYNELALLNHPDKGGDEKKFKDIQKAYKILINKKTRKIYTDSLSSTYDELSNDFKKGAHDYLQSNDDFVKTKSKDKFMEQFNQSLNEKTRQNFINMNRDADEKSKKFDQIKNNLDDFIDQHNNDESIKIKSIDKLSKTFDVETFNKMFEQNKKQSTAMEHYQQVDETNCDLCPIDDGHNIDDDNEVKSSSLNFQTYKYNDIIDCDHTIPLESDKKFDHVDDLLIRLKNERDKPIQPIECSDNNPLSCVNMGV